MAARFYVVRRPFTVGGRRYVAGDRVKEGVFEPFKAAQLVEQRMLMPPDPGPMEAARTFDVGDRSFKRGDSFPIEIVSLEKRKQLLEHKYIQPATPA